MRRVFSAGVVGVGKEVEKKVQGFSVLKVVGVVLIGVSFAFEADVSVSCVEIVVVGEAEEEFECVEEEEGEEEEFELLAEMDAFVVDEGGVGEEGLVFEEHDGADGDGGDEGEA